MSLINQVLRDLDQRHAAAGGMPAAVKAPAVQAAPAARYWRTAALATAAMLAVGGTASTLTWWMSQRGAPAAIPPAAAGAAPAVQATPAVQVAQRPEVITTPVVVATNTVGLVSTPAPAPAAPAPRSNTVVNPTPAAASATPAKDTPAPKVEPPKTPEVATPAEPAIAAAGKREAIASPSALVAAAAPAAIASTTRAPVLGESRIEKKAPNRTAHERAEAEYQRGVVAHQQGSLAEAASAYANALREEVHHAPARQALAGLLIAQGRADEAKLLLTEGLARTPRHAGMAMMLSRLHAERGEWQRAIEVMDAAPVNAPAAEDLAFRAAVLQRLHRHAEAAEHFSAALRTTPHHGVWWMGLGMSLAADGRNDSAKEAFNRARASGSLTPELAQYVEQRLRQL